MKPTIESDRVKEVRFYCYHSSKKIIFYIASVLTLGMVYLIFTWFPELYVYLYEEKGSLEEADVLLVVRKDQSNVLVKISKGLVRYLPNVPKKELYYVWFDNQLYYLNESSENFVIIENLMLEYLSQDSKNILECLNGLDPIIVKELNDFYGDNVIDITNKSYLEFFLEDFFSPVIMFQMSSAIIFGLIGYLVYGIVLSTFILAATISLSYDKMIASRKMRKMAYIDKPVKVFRNVNGGFQKIELSSKQLVIGDLVHVESGQDFTADMVLLRGACLVSEAILTGEPNPIRKSGAIVNHMAEEEIKIRPQNILNCGSNCIMNKSQSVQAVVIKTAWNTSKGELIANILNSKPAEFKFKRDIFLVLGILFSLGCFFILLLLLIKIRKDDFRWGNFLDKSLEILTTALPPALILSFTIGIKTANTRLKEKNVLPVIVDKINEAGRVKYVCFDKTGTLTEMNVRIGGVLAQEDMERNDIALKVSELIHNKNYKAIMEVMSCCHSLQILHDKVGGDPLDEEIFAHTKFILKEELDNKETKRFIIPSKDYRRLFSLPPDFKYEVLDIHEFTPERRCMSVRVTDTTNREQLILVKGAPERIKAISTSESIPDNYDELLLEYSEKGYRIISLGIKRLNTPVDDPAQHKVENAEKDIQFIGFVLLTNPLKPETQPTISALKKVDICCKMITGDNIYTAINVSCTSGIIDENENIFIGTFDEDKKIYNFTYFSNNEIKNRISKDDFRSHVFHDNMSRRTIFHEFNETSLEHVLDKCALMENTKIAVEGKVFEEIFMNKSNLDLKLCEKFFEYAIVFGRTSPKQKEAIVEALKYALTAKSSVYCVAYVGDGSNDSRALRVANVGLSLGSNESSIASAFNTKITSIEPLVEILIEGRANLELAMQNFKFIMITSIFQFVSISLLGIYHLDYTTADYIYFDNLTIIPIALLMCYTKASDKLNRNLPKVSIFNWEIIFSICGHLFLGIFFVVIAVNLLMSFPLQKSTEEAIGLTGEFLMDHYRFYQSKLMIFFMDVISIAICFAVSHAYPFRKSVFTNYVLVAYSMVLALFHFYVLYADELDMYYLSYFMVRFTQHPIIDEFLRWQFVSFTLIASLISYCYEGTNRTYFQIKKRQQNHILRKLQRHEKLTKDEEEINTDFLFEVVSVN